MVTSVDPPDGPVFGVRPVTIGAPGVVSGGLVGVLVEVLVDVSVGVLVEVLVDVVSVSVGVLVEVLVDVVSADVMGNFAEDHTGRRGAVNSDRPDDGFAFFVVAGSF